MTIKVLPPVKAVALVVLGVTIGAMGFYVANADDAPGAALMGLLLMVTAVALGLKAARGRLPVWAARTALGVGVLVAGFAAVLTHGVVVMAPLFAKSQEVSSVIGAAPPPQYAEAVERARELVRAAMMEQNLTGVSVAVGRGGAVVWAEGFGWRDVETRTPVTPRTRFHIGTAASDVAAAVAPLGLSDTGTDPAAAWSPEHVGEPEEDFPPLAIVRHVILQPLGLMPAEYPLPGDRATFYVPRVGDDPRRGRRLMYMRDLACCAKGMAFYSTPSDLVRFAMATDAGSIDGALAGGTVMSLATGREGVVVAVTSNMAHANTSAMAHAVEEAFATHVGRP
jgi:CubicO group peptidase (beta-lactamase class C family)